MRQLWIALLVIALGCAGGNGPGSVQFDADTAPHSDTLSDSISPDCMPACGGRNCGPDGCGGSCGQCTPFIEQCSDAGMCEPFGCKSSKDCPGSLVCDEDLGECVICVSDLDCPDGQTCGADSGCHSPVACQSDKECKSVDMVCDAAAGFCVECLKLEHCDNGMICQEGFCLDAVCTTEDVKCDGDVVLACPEGTAWKVSTVCEADQFCQDGTCLNCACEAASIWCDGEVYKVCSDDCRTLQYEEDCLANDQHCFAGACIDTVCPPEELFCVDDDTAAACADDGMSFNEADCPSGNYCEDGGCEPWACEPDSHYCNGAVAVTCNSQGSGPVKEVECDALELVCVGGECVELECEPDSVWCLGIEELATCAEDGLSYESEQCDAEHSCLDGACLPWTCTPGTPMCDGTVATQCDDSGLGPVVGGEDCGTEEKVCLNGDCQDCEPACDGLECGDDGCGGLCGECMPGQVCIDGKCPPDGIECDDGNATDWDGCTNGDLTEFRVNIFSDNYQRMPSATSTPSGQLIASWQTKGQFGEKNQVAQRAIVAGTGPTGVDSPLSQSQEWDMVGPVSVYAGSQKNLTAWNSIDEDGDGYGIFARFSTPDASPLGEAMQVNTAWYGDQADPAIACISDEQCLIVWTNHGAASDMSGYMITGQWLALDGAKKGLELPLLNEIGVHHPGVACSQDGTCLVVWTAEEGDTDGKGIWAGHFQFGDELVTDAQQVNTGDAGKQESAAVAVDKLGNFLIVWASSAQDSGGDYGVFGRLMKPDGNWAAGQFQVSQPLAGNQWFPQVAASHDNGFLVVWYGAVDGDNVGIAARPFDPIAGLGLQVTRLNEYTAGSQQYPRVSAAPDGFIVIWESDMNDIEGGKLDIMARRIGSDGVPLYL